MAIEMQRTHINALTSGTEYMMFPPDYANKGRLRVLLAGITLSAVTAVAGDTAECFIMAYPGGMAAEGGRTILAANVAAYCAAATATVAENVCVTASNILLNPGDSITVKMVESNAAVADGWAWVVVETFAEE